MTEEKTIYEVEARHERGVINFEEYAMSTAGVLKQVAVIQEVMKSVMHLDEHYGTIPGTKKPSLYKAGAEKLSLTFRLRPEYEIRRSDLPNGHREYEVVATLFHIPTGQSVGQGVGSATTMEGKYRYRTGPVELTGKPVPKEYWTDRNIDLIGGKGFVTKKNDAGTWEIAIRGEQVEHENPADYYNTVLKMAKKRAHVDAILTATAASDIFTQDVEDMPEVMPGAKKAEAKPPLKEPEKKKSAPPAPENLLVITGAVTGVEAKPGTNPKTNKPYNLYTIMIEGDKYLSFDDTHADLARSAEQSGTPVTVSFTVDKWGNKLTSLAVDDKEPGSNG
jgi:hypothetical protein